MITNFRNSGKKTLEAEKRIASFCLFYDQDEIEIFFKDFVESIKQSKFRLSDNMKTFLTTFKNVVEHNPDFVNSTSKSSGTFFVEPLINKIIEESEMIVFSESKKRAFRDWMLNVETMCSDSESSGQFILGQQCCDLFYWNNFLDNIESINNSGLDYRDKLAAIKQPEIQDSVSNRRMKISEVTQNTFEDSIYTTGLPGVDDYINILPTNLIYVVARPSVGKSMYVLNMMIKNALKKVHSLYISLEMSSAQTNSRVLTWIKDGDVEPEEVDELRKSPLYKKIDKYLDIIDDKTTHSCEMLLSVMEGFLKDYPDGIIILDSINLTKYPGESDWDSLRHMSQAMKRLCREKNAIIVACAQASRSADAVGLGMDSLYGSSSLEQDADIIIGLEPKSKNKEDIKPLTLKIVKNRDAMKDIDIDIKMKGSSSHFYDMYGEDYIDESELEDEYNEDDNEDNEDNEDMNEEGNNNNSSSNDNFDIDNIDIDFNEAKDSSETTIRNEVKEDNNVDSENFNFEGIN